LKDIEKHGEFVPLPKSAAKSGAARARTRSHEDAKETDLARLVEAWPTLSANVQAAIVALMDGSR
jgi:hypothetical protein